MSFPSPDPAVADRHPTPEEIDAYRNSRLTSQEEWRIARHLGSCDSCQKQKHIQDLIIDRANRQRDQIQSEQVQEEALGAHLTPEQVITLADNVPDTDPVARDQWERHLERCRSCRWLVEEQKQMSTILAAEDDGTTFGPVPETPERERAQRTPRFLPKWQSFSLQFSTVAATALVMLFFGQHWGEVTASQEFSTRQQQIQAKHDADVQQMARRYEDQLAAAGKERTAEQTKATQARRDLERTKAEQARLQVENNRLLQAQAALRSQLNSRPAVPANSGTTNAGTSNSGSSGPLIPPAIQDSIRRLQTGGGQNSERGGEVIPLLPRTTLLLSPRPTFEWQPVDGADGYELVIQDGEKHSYGPQETLSGTQWKFPKGSPGLPPGKDFTWVVTAVKKPADETEVTREVGKMTPIRFRVLSSADARKDAMAIARQYAAAGLLDDAIRVLDSISQPDAPEIKKLRAAIEALRPVPTPK